MLVEAMGIFWGKEWWQVGKGVRYVREPWATNVSRHSGHLNKEQPTTEMCWEITFFFVHFLFGKVVFFFKLIYKFVVDFLLIF